MAVAFRSSRVQALRTKLSLLPLLAAAYMAASPPPSAHLCTTHLRRKVLRTFMEEMQEQRHRQCMLIPPLAPRCTMPQHPPELQCMILQHLLQGHPCQCMTPRQRTAVTAEGSVSLL